MLLRKALIVSFAAAATLGFSAVQADTAPAISAASLALVADSDSHGQHKDKMKKKHRDHSCMGKEGEEMAACKKEMAEKKKAMKEKWAAKKAKCKAMEGDAKKECMAKLKKKHMKHKDMDHKHKEMKMKHKEHKEKAEKKEHGDHKH